LLRAARGLRRLVFSPAGRRRSSLVSHYSIAAFTGLYWYQFGFRLSLLL
jgi:hypothetical protein